MTYERFDVVRVPFPFADIHAARNRPALVLSDERVFNTPSGHSVMAMITSADTPTWPLDCPIGDLQAAGLPAPSKVRFKLFSLDHRLVRNRLGHLAETDRAAVAAALARLLGMAQPEDTGAVD